MKRSDIININEAKQQSANKKRLEMVLRDSLDNIEDYSFEMFFNCDVDSILDFEILPCQIDTSPDELQASA